MVWNCFLGLRYIFFMMCCILVAVQTIYLGIDLSEVS